MLSKLFSKPISDQPSIQTLDQLSTLIDTRIIQIATSQDCIGVSRCFPDTELNLLYFLKTQAPLPGTIFRHPTTRKPSSVLEHISQAGRTAVSYISFESEVSFYTVLTTFDISRNATFSKLADTSWVNIPATLNEAELTLSIPKQYIPDPNDVVLLDSSYYRILSLQERETHNICAVEPADVR